jgi:replication factor C small subunit
VTITHLFEKYRPVHIADIVLLPRIRASLESFLARQHAPHILLVGPPGVGKTTIAMALAKDMNWEIRIKNAAAYINIEDVRTEISEFALPQPTLAPFFGEEQRHHCLVLDEADHIPGKAQAALRGILEEAAQTNHATFILTANDGGKIDQAIRSRCAVFDLSYSTPSDRAQIEPLYQQRLATVLDQEGIRADQATIVAFVERSFPDMRAIFNELQLRI